MKKTWIIVIAVVAVLVIYCVSSYNSLVTQEETVGTAWSNVENQYQRRSDLIPNLVNTVKGYAAHEKETFDAVVSARAKATQMTIDIEDLTPEKIEAYQKAQGAVGSALSRLLAVTENYPELKANENFKELQAQLEGTENRISLERRKFNETAREYNTSIRRFPKNIVASMFGFEKRPGAVRHVSAHDRVDRRQREDSRLDRLYNPAVERCQRAGVNADGGHAHGPAPIQA